MLNQKMLGYICSMITVLEGLLIRVAKLHGWNPLEHRLKRIIVLTTSSPQLLTLQKFLARLNMIYKIGYGIYFGIH